MVWRLAGAMAWLLIGCTLMARADERPLSFSRDVKPILSNRCFACHGFDEKDRKADLRLDDVSAAIQGGIIKPGKSSESELVARLLTDDVEIQMPPPSSKKPRLTSAEVDVVKKWIDQGAKTDGHWAFQPPHKPTVPVVPNANEATTEIDRFLAAAREQHGIKPSPVADRRTLLRRLYFDLLGLPPTAEQVAAFENDKSSNAYEKVVDELLASPHYGERMAVFWLDLVRYADSAGYHSDNPRNVTPFRDYVIQSFNANLPFDSFTREQLAGDLLPNPTTWQKVASGYNRLLQTTEEGGAQPKEYTAKYAADRVRNLGSAWLGLTLGCCECHNHKFDPVSIRDFYSLEAYFADIQEAAVGRREPGMPVPNAEQSVQLQALSERIAAAQKELDQAATLAAEKVSALGVEQEIQWDVQKPIDFHVKGESKLQLQDDLSLKSIYKVAAQETYVVAFTPAAGKITGLRLEALADEAFPSKGPGTAPNGNFVLTNLKIMRVDEQKKEQPVKLDKASASHSQQGFDVATAIDGKNKSGWAVLPQVGQSHDAIFQFANVAELNGAQQLKVILEFKSPHPQHNIGRLRLSTTTSEQPVQRWIHGDLRALLAKPVAQRTADDLKKIVAFYRERSPELQPQRDQVQKLAAEKTALEEAIPKSLIATAGNPRTIRVLARGNWLDDSGDIVEPTLPLIFTGGKPTSGHNGEGRGTRLDLANWLVGPDHPLTSRVFVNRVWKLFFGRGLVKSVGDFGTQGDFPTHPELLDYLAVQFRDDGWNVKQLVKRIVLTQAYQQSSRSTPEMRERDPQNMWLGRQTPLRLEAEFVRDTALATSGLLEAKVGGPSVFPYQPRGYWAYLNFPTREWQNDQGAGLYRRGLYTHWQRSFLHPSLLAFDAPSREECTFERARSNTPLQALVVLNDPTYVEAARGLAIQAMKQASTSPQRLQFLYARVLQRSATPEESTALEALVKKHTDEYTRDEAAAKELLQVGALPTPPELSPAEVAAWTSVARVLLNLHETITRN